MVSLDTPLRSASSAMRMPPSGGRGAFRFELVAAPEAGAPLGPAVPDGGAASGAAVSGSGAGAGSGACGAELLGIARHPNRTAPDRANERRTRLQRDRPH